MRARIFRQPRNAMQSGTANTHCWVLEWAPTGRTHPDPLMGWSGGGSTRNQLHLHFPSKEEAVAYATRQGIAFDLELPPPRVAQKPRAYADNFRYGRTENWTH